MLSLHRAERSDTLADALADVLRTPLADPMATEIVAVPARGVERWLTQHLATTLGADAGRTDGIAANIDFSSPAALSEAVVDAVRTTPRSHAGPYGRHDPWEPARMVWQVLAVLDENIDDPALDIIARHIGSGRSATAGPGRSATAGSGRSATAGSGRSATAGDSDLRIGRRFATARHLADLFDRYGRQRPAMLVEWANGHDTDGSGAALASDMKWQARFWRAVHARIGVDHPALLLDDVCARVRSDPDAVDLPERISVFGATRVTESFRQILSALARHRDVHLFLPHPSPALWASVARADTQAGSETVDQVRRADRPIPAIDHPLLAGLSRDVQELQQRIAPIVDSDIYHESRVQQSRAGAGVDSTRLLPRLQADLRDDTVHPTTAPADSSLEIHACHGAERQVEVMRDRLLHLFADDSTLEPRDVLIMCPDVESFAPLIRGAFGQSGLDHPAFNLRVRLADRGPRQVNPVLDVVASIVELAASRAAAGDIVDLLSRSPVRSRFAMDDDDLDMIREWLAHSNIRWGLGENERARFGLSGFRQGTFASGVDRIALGAVAEEADGEWLGAALPLAGVESTEIDLAGRFTEFVDRLADLFDRMGGRSSRAAWQQTLIDVVDQLTLSDPGEEWQRAQAVRAITDALDADESDSQHLLLADIRDLMAGVVAGRPTRANFRTGELTVCTMVPMRSVPHRVIVLLGVDADTFPRAQRTDGDDVLGRDPLVGERNPRDEDRQLFLDAIGAAGDSLLVFYNGADPVNGSRIPPAVVVSELAESVATLRGLDDPSDVVITHTLHGFDRLNFTPGAIGSIPTPFSFDAELLAGAQALDSDAVPSARLSDAEVGDLEPADIELRDLVAFLANPIEGFVRQRLGARMPDDDRAHTDELDVELDALDRWGVGDRFLRQMLAGDDLVTSQAAELRRGNLPPYEFGRRELVEISETVSRVYDAVASVRTQPPVTRDVVVTLPDGRRVHGSIADIVENSPFGTTIVTATYSRVRAKQRLTAWLGLLLLAASAADASPPSALVVGRGGAGAVAQSMLTAPDDARAVLNDLVRLRDLGLRSPLPLPLEPAEEYATKVCAGVRSDAAVETARRSFDGMFGAGTDTYLRFVFGADVTSSVAFDEILRMSTSDDPRWAGLILPGEAEAPLFTRLARALWNPLLDHETMS
ncbi:exodeoxyribonuclease V subunit gamma [Gordonia sp. 852002-50395_SCH5434458]|uniref:exodeoxyribonuclease V subunit gamma n=1 Tax=Gordonia sp. 852002-50395_SCH5434458 TaxID=1834090 RepID=UPI0007EC27E2|nr:exodeoxyribonuclease V subunit gamma [Gordonia sp. 852002-50395_SCH5434458]OBC02629.1 exodeoxyribonuclease V subunit gamma [Gordonia sp. 852002-50395_SCH5434458]